MSEMNTLDYAIVHSAARGLFIAEGYLPPRLWEDLRALLQRRYREATGETDAVLVIAASPHPIVAEGVLEVAKDIARGVAQQWDDGEGSRTFSACMEIHDRIAALAREAPAVEPGEADSDLRCKATGHLCGTDTWEVGRPCRCENCQEYIAREASR